jgi:mRNA interferase HigB
MEIRGSEVIEIFCKKHADVVDPLVKWIDIVEKAQWTDHNDLKADFPSADYIGKRRYVFNIKGNNYRLAAIVVFFAGVIDIRFIGTHAEYSKIKDIEKI